MPKLKRKKAVAKTATKTAKKTVKVAKVTKSPKVAKPVKGYSSTIQKMEKEFLLAKTALGSSFGKEIDASKKLEKKLKADFAKAEKNKKDAKSKQTSTKTKLNPAAKAKLKAAFNSANISAEKVKKEMMDARSSVQQLMLRQKKHQALNALIDKFEKSWAKKESAANKPKKAKRKVKKAVARKKLEGMTSGGSHSSSM